MSARSVVTCCLPRRALSVWRARAALGTPMTLALRVAALAAGLAAPAAVLAQGVEPGQWRLWRAGSERLPTSAPTLELCVSGQGAKDPTLLVGEAPGDGNCRTSAVRRTGAATLVLELTCPDGKRVRGTVSQPDGRQFTTRLDHVLSRSPQPGVVYVHGRRVGECTP
ncbi:MAG: DUF3617 domain-containing protein [Rubrivivax sp.]